MRRYQVEWGHLGFVLAIAAWIAWYLSDTISVSVAMDNLLFVVPICGIALVLCAFVIRQCIRPLGAVAPAGRTGVIGAAHSSGPAAPGSTLRIVAVAASLVLLVTLVGYVGFDGAIFLFCMATMAICGERRPVWLVAYSVIVTLVVVFSFRAILPFPMHTLLV